MYHYQLTHNLFNYFPAVVNIRLPIANIPPRVYAKIKQHGNCKNKPHPRDNNLRKIRKAGRKKWKINSGYHLRS